MKKKICLSYLKTYLKSGSSAIPDKLSYHFGQFPLILPRIMWVDYFGEKNRRNLSKYRPNPDFFVASLKSG